MDQQNNRILIVDDDRSIHEDYRKVLCPNNIEFQTNISDTVYEIDSAYQGEEALQKVIDAEKSHHPYGLVFMDIRMPPGWDGVETIQRIWSRYPYIEMVICTAFFDYSWSEIVVKLGTTDKLLFLKKPFDSVTVKQMVITLLKKWQLNYDARQDVVRLEQEVTSRTQQLATTLKKMEMKNRELADAQEKTLEASKATSSFIATVSHEIRTPMNGILGMTTLLYDTTLSQDQRFFVDTVKTSSDALLTIINDILDFSKIEAGKLELVIIDFDMRQPFEEVIDLFIEAAQRKDIEILTYFNPKIPQSLIGDPGRIRQVISNYMSNALKFTDEGSVIINCDIIDQTDTQITLQVDIEDSGIGISETVQSTLFRPFTQAGSATTRVFGGSGLGLATCKQLIEMMGGKTGVESQEDNGSRFWFSIPLKINHSEQTNTATSTLKDQSLWLMIGNKTNQLMITDHIQLWGMKFKSFTSTQEITTTLFQNPNLAPNFILLDYTYAAKDTLSLTKHLNKHFPNIQIIVLSSHSKHWQTLQTANVNFDGHLLTPIRPSKLPQTLTTATAVNNVTGRSDFFSAEKNTLPMKFNARLLVVEDNAINQKVAQRMLERLGCRVHVVSNGIEAIVNLEKSRYDLIFMDCQMPKMGGFEATKKIRSEESKDQHTPIIAMTANAMLGDKDKCLDQGMDDYLSKPFSPEHLQKKLLQWLPNKQV